MMNLPFYLYAHRGDLLVGVCVHLGTERDAALFLHQIYECIVGGGGGRWQQPDNKLLACTLCNTNEMHKKMCCMYVCMYNSTLLRKITEICTFVLVYSLRSLNPKF